jgi:hypothetical protein
MKRILLAVLAIGLAGADLRAADAAEDSSLTIVCADRQLPRMSEVGAITGIRNFSAVYAERERLLDQAARICRNPAVAQVRFVPAAQIVVEPLNLAAR